MTISLSLKALTYLFCFSDLGIIDFLGVLIISVIFDGNDKLIGQTVKIKIDKVNQNNLFGKIDSNSDMKAA